MTATMIQTTAFLPYVQPKAPGVSVLMAEFQIRQAAIEFCERTRLWRHRVEQAVTTNEPVMLCPDYAAIHAIDRAEFATTADPTNPMQLAAVPLSDLPPGWRTDPEAPPQAISQIIHNRIVLYPFAPGTVSMTVYLKPRNGQNYTALAVPMTDYFNQVPDFFAEQYAEIIGDGALTRILALPKKPYTEPGMAQFYGSRFREACDRLFGTNISGQQRAPRRVRYNDF